MTPSGAKRKGHRLIAFTLSQVGVFLTAILDREAFTELHLSFRRSMTMMKPMLAASRLQRQDITATRCLTTTCKHVCFCRAEMHTCAVPLLKECEGTWVCWSDR